MTKEEKDLGFLVDYRINMCHNIMQLKRKMQSWDSSPVIVLIMRGKY